MSTQNTVEQADNCRMTFYKRLGAVSNDVLAPVIDVSIFGGAPRWPVRPAWRTIKREHSLILASDGLSAPMDDAAIGFGTEVFMETKDPDLLQLDIYAGVAETWLFTALSEVCNVVAGHPDFCGLLAHHGHLTIEVGGEAFPERLRNDEGRVGVLVGAPTEDVPDGFEQFGRQVRFIPVTVLSADETAYLAETDSDEKQRFAGILKQRRLWHYSDLERPSLVRSGVLVTEAVVFNNSEAENLYLAALRYVAEYEHDAALKKVDKALALEENAWLFCLKGDILLYNDEEDEALQAFDAAIASNPDYYKPYLEKGKYHYNQNEFDTANDFLLKAASHHPSVETYVWLGKNDIDREDTDAAIRRFTQAVALIDETYQYDLELDPLSLRAACYQKTNQPVKAIQDLKKALEISKKQWQAFRKLFDALKTMGAFDDGIQVCEDYVSTDPAEAFEAMSKLYLIMGEHEKALDAMNRWMEKCPEDGRDIEKKRSRLYIEMERFEEAVACLDRLIANPEDQWDVESDDYKDKADILTIYLNDPDRVEACHDAAIERFADEYDPVMAKAGFLIKNNRLEEAIALFESLLASDRRIDKTVRCDIFMHLADCHCTLGQQTAAIAVCDRAAEKLNDIDISIKKAHCYADLGDYAAAIQAFDQGIKRIKRSDRGRAYLKKARALRDWEQYEAALEAYDAVIARTPDDDDPHFNKGLIYQDLEEHDKAIAAFHRVLAIHEAENIHNNDTLGARINRGSSYEKAGMIDEAIADYDHVIAHEDYKYRYQAFFNRGSVRYHQGDMEQAREDWEAAYALKPDYHAILTDLPELYIVTGKYEKAVAVLDTGLQNKTAPRLLAILLYLKAVALRQIGRLEDAQACEATFRETAARHDGDFQFTIKHLLNYLTVSEAEKEHLRELGACFG